MSIDNEDVIVEALEDAFNDPTEPTTESDSTPEVSTETQVEATPEAVESTPDPQVTPEPEDAQVASPAAKAAQAAAQPQDDFEKKFGIPKESTPGRENRIPYSRVTKIVAKAVKDAESALTPKIQEFESKIKEYEGYLSQATELKSKVDSFEKVMMNEPEKFITELAKLPMYQPLLAKLFQPETPAAPSAPVQDEMPQPDQELSDGSKVYSMEGLGALNAWNRDQARKETLAEVQKIYGPIAHSFEEQQKQAAAMRYQQEVLMPAVDAQIAEAHTWPLFKENEAAIVKVLNENPKFNLERAYQAVVLPLLQTNRDSMRKQVLADLKKAPVSTSAPHSIAKPGAKPARTGPIDNEDVIREAIAAASGRS